MKIVVLVLASHNNKIYENARLIWKSYSKLNPDIKVFFVYGSSGLLISDLDEYDLVFPAITENYNPGMLLKTVEAFEYILNNFEFNFLVRTNLSTFWDFNNLIDHCNSLPSIGCYSGDGPLTTKGYDKNGYYLSGIDTIITPEIVWSMVINRNRLNYKIAEDSMMGLFINKHLNVPFLSNRITYLESIIEKNNILLDSNTSIPLTDIIKSSVIKGVDHYRVKSRFNRQHIDFEIYISLLQSIYNISL